MYVTIYCHVSQCVAARVRVEEALDDSGDFDSGMMDWHAVL